MPIDEARKLGAIALLGEKYGDKVRVVQFGKSVELCGGCHAASTGRLGMFKILSESSVAAGVRRVEAITGAQVENLLYSLIDTAAELRSIFNNAPDLKTAVQKTIDENSELHSELSGLMRDKAAQLKQQFMSQAKEVNGLKVVKGIAHLPAEYVKDMAYQIRAELPGSIVVLGSINDEKPLLTAAASDEAVTACVHVGKNIREAAKLIQGGGGGQPHFATAGGRNPEGLLAAIDKLVELLTA